MSPVTCPSCGEKGSLPNEMIGRKIRCQKCGKVFVAGAIAPAPIEVLKPAGDSIEVDGLDPSTWAASASAVAEVAEPPVAEPTTREPAPAFAASPEHEGGTARQYKVLTTKDRWFEGKFEIGRLEEALNHYARQGWAVRAMATPHVTGFSGGPREELVILLER